MHHPIRCLPSLIYQVSLPHIRDSLAILKRYEGVDWKNIEVYQPMTLFKTNDMELNLLNWNKGKHMIYYNNQSMRYIKVLGGSFNISETSGRRVRDYYAKSPMLLPNVMAPSVTVYHKQLIADQTHVFFPFSRVSMIAKEPSVTLQIITY